MTGIHSEHDNDPISASLNRLRVLARRYIVDGEELGRSDTLRKNFTLRRISDLGGACRMTEREMVSLVLRGVFSDGPSCWCSKCRAAYLKDLDLQE